MATHWKLSGDYYVDGISGDDGNAGTSTAPFKTIGAAAAAVSSYEKIVVGTGVYNESINMGTSKANCEICADGNVIIDGTGLTRAIFYYGRGWYIYDVTVINGNNYGIEQAVTYYFKNYYTRCTFKDCDHFWYQTTYSTQYQVTHLECKYINFTLGVTGRTTGIYIQYVDFVDCVFYNAPAMIERGGGSTSNTYITKHRGCWFDGDFDGSATTGVANTRPVVYQRGYTNNYTMDNCFFGPGAMIKSGEGFPGEGNTYKTPAEANAANAVLFFNTSFLQATASYNTTVSGSGAIEATAYSITSGNNTDIYSSRLQTAFSYLATQAPTTAFGYQNNANNILVPAGGATWGNITSSADGLSLQISSSDVPSGSITSATVNLGSIVPINNIRSSWTTQVANACAPAVYSSSALNEYPTRYTFEMKYGNQSDLSSNEYKIFCFDEKPYIDLNGSGSGDINFNTSSFSDISAQYLQFRITLRTNLSGSA
jgi:hypothetical protein